MAEHAPILTASGDKIYGETPEDGIIARVYGDEVLARKIAVLVNATTGVSTEALEDGAVSKLVEALDGLVLVCRRTGDALEDFEEQAERFQAETGKMRPGKDVPELAPDLGGTRDEYKAWAEAKIASARAALAAHMGEETPA